MLCRINSDLNVRYDGETDYIQIYADGAWRNSVLAGYSTSVALVPNMTSYTLPYGRVSASSEYSGRPAYQAFNGKPPIITDGTTFWMASSRNIGEWLEYQFAQPVSITKFKFSALVDISFNLQRYSDNEWINVLSGSLEANSNFKSKEYTIDGRIVTSRVRIYITAAKSDIVISAAQFYGSKIL